MAKNAQGEEIKEDAPTLTPELNADGSVKGTEDAEFESTLKDLEAGNEPPKPTRSELEKATFTAKSTLKRIKELGGDPATLLADEVVPPAEKPPVDTTQFVTKADLAEQEVNRLAKSPSEAKLIMWYVRNKGLSISDAHFMANKNRISKLTGEINRSRETTPSLGGGAGERGKDRVDAPELSPSEKMTLAQAGMVYDPAKKAYVGKKIQHRFDEASKTWVTEKIPAK